MIRESRDLDKISSEYSSALKVLNPRLVNRLYKTYKEKLNIAKNPDRYHHRHEDVFDYYNDNDYDNKDVYPRRNEEEEEEEKDRRESKQYNHNRMTTNQQQGRAWVSKSGASPVIKQQQQQRSNSSDAWAHSGRMSRDISSFNDPTDVMNNDVAIAVTKHNSSYGNNKDQQQDEVQRQRRNYDNDDDDDSGKDDVVKTRNTYPAALEFNIIDEDNNNPDKVHPVVKIQRHTSVRTIAVHKDRPDDQGKSDMNQPELTSSASIDLPLSNKHTTLSNRSSTIAGLNMQSLQASTVMSSTAISTDSLGAAIAPLTIDIDVRRQGKGIHGSSTTTPAYGTTHNQAQPLSISLKQQHQQQQQQQHQSIIGRTDPSRSNVDNHLESSTEDFSVPKMTSKDLYGSAHRTDDVPRRDNISYDESMMMASPNHLSRSMLISGLEGNMQGVHQPLSHQSATSSSDHMKIDDDDDGSIQQIVIKKEDIVVRKSDMVFLEDYDDEDDEYDEYDPYQLDSTRSKSKNFNNFSYIDHDSTEIDTSTSFRIELPSENVGDKSGGKQSIHSSSLYIDLNINSNARRDNRRDVADIRDEAPRINKFKQINSSSNSSSRSQFTSNMLSPYREHNNNNNNNYSNYSIDDLEEKGLPNNYNDNNNDNSDSLLFSPMSDNNMKVGSRNNTFRLKDDNSTFGDYDDDEVLFGTTRLSGGKQDYNSSSQMMIMEEELGNTFQLISPPTTSDLGTSGPFERDSLGLTIATNPSSSSTDSNLQSVRPNHRGRSSFSPVAELSMEHTRTTCTEDDESIPPPTYDSVISMKGSRSKQQQTTSSDRMGGVEESNLFIDLSDTAESMPVAIAADALVWCSGKASLEAIELATAIEVFVSTIKLEPVIVELIPEVSLFFFSV